VPVILRHGVLISSDSLAAAVAEILDREVCDDERYGIFDRLRVSIKSGRPYGADDWIRQTVAGLGLEHTVRPEGRPREESHSAADTKS
jgi:hypothetical protein